MTMTVEALRHQLSAIEPDEATFSGLGASEIPLLEQLARDPEDWMAARAVLAASRIRDPRVNAILARAASDARASLRVAAAVAAKNLPPADGDRVLLQAMNDSDVGVRKFAVLSITTGHAEPVYARLREIESGDPEPMVRNAARSAISNR